MVLCGSISLISPLLEHGLADELLLLVDPVLLGKGKRIFAEGDPTALVRTYKHPFFPHGHPDECLQGRRAFEEPAIGWLCPRRGPVVDR